MKQLDIKLLGRDFSISCPEEEEANLLKSVNYLSHKIEEIQKTGNVIGVDKTIIMAALNITHEFLNQEGGSNIHTMDYKNKLSNLGYNYFYINESITQNVKDIKSIYQKVDSLIGGKYGNYLIVNNNVAKELNLI